MKNKKIQYFTNAAALILGAVLLTTCTVGLGDAVDTKSPKVSITHPPVQSIIKNTFTLRGTASDDNELVGVMITVTNTETDEVFDSYQATVDRATNTWSFVANRRNEDGSFEFEDGKYQIVATAVDGANRKTVASTTYEIDNTAPVLVLNRPGTVGPVGGVKPEVYGSELKLTGSANDDHALDLVSMRVFREDGTQIGEPLTYPNVSGVGMDILLAKHYASPADADQQALTDRYAAIYDHSTGGTQNFYCLVDISDYAREYDPPANVASADNTRGNVSQAFWLYDGIYSRVFDKSGFGLAMSDLTSVLSGRYASVATAGEVREYLEANQQNSSVWSENAVTFSLNPENSPYYEVVGYNALATNEDITAQASNGTNLTVRVSAGRDQRPLLSDTIRVYLVPCNANGAPLSGEGDKILLLSIAELADNTAAIEERNDRLSKTGNDYVVSVDVGTLVNGNYYLVKVEGKDQAGNEITDLNGTFGFQVIASGNPPVLVVNSNSPSDLSYISANSVNYEGMVEAEGGFDSLTATVRIIRLSDGVAVRNGETQTFTIDPSDSNPNWAFTLDTADKILDDGLYLARVTLKATDLKNTITEQTLRLYIDHQAPNATITKVTPYYGYDSGTGKYTVNGTVDVTLSMTDNDQLVSLAYTIGKIVTQPEITVSTPVDNRTISVNTSSILVPANLPVTVTLQDRAGNTAVISIPDTLCVNQDTDKPVIDLTNPSALAADKASAQGYWITGSSITGSIEDDDAVGSLRLNIYDTDDSTTSPVAKKLFTAGEMTGSGKRVVFSYDISAVDTNTALADGIYRLVLTANDDSAVASDVTEGWFSYDTTNPELIDVDTTPPGLTLTNTGFSISGKGFDANALCSTNPIVVKQRLGSGEKIPVPVEITVDNDQNCTWTIDDLPRVPTSAGIGGQVNLSNGTNNGSYEYEITVFDQAGQFSVETVKVQFDSIAPVVNKINDPSEGEVVGKDTGFGGTANDTNGTGVSKIQFSVDGGQNWTDAIGTTNWQASYSFTSNEGEKTLWVKAIDNAGNEGKELTQTFIYDAGAPDLTIDTKPADLMKDAFSLSGSASDGYKLKASDTVVVTQQFENETAESIALSTFAWNQDTTVAPAIDDYSGCTWAIANLPRGGTDETSGINAENGTYKYVVTVYDAVGRNTVSETITVKFDTNAPYKNTIDRPASGSIGIMALSSADYMFRGSADDKVSRVAKVWYQITKSSNASPDPADYTELVTSGDWSFSRDLVEYTGTPGDTEISEGTGYYLHVFAEDNVGNRTQTAARVTFDVDLKDPEVTEDVINTTTIENRRVGFELGGAATDSHGIDTVTITQSFNGEEAIEITGGLDLTPDGTGFDWTLADLPRGNSAGTIGNPSTDNGTYEYRITTTDLVGKTHTITRRINFDTIGPDIEFTAPADGGWQASGNVPVKGLATDLTAVGGVYYSTAASAPTIPTAPDDNADWTAEGWQVAGGTLGSWQVALTGLAEGSHGVWVSAMDTNGNTTPAIQRNFGVDLNLPALTGVNTPPADTNAEFSFTGTATDTNALAGIPVTITQSKDGGDAVVISGNISTPGTAQNTNWELLALPRNPVLPNSQITFVPANDGVYDYVITATDIAGKIREITRTVRIDTTAPTLTVDPAVVTSLSGWKNSASIPVSGTLTETGSGISSVTYSLNGGSANALSVSGSNWAGNISVSNGENQTVSFTATDKAGNAVTSATYTFSVDTDFPELTVVTPTGPQRTNLSSPVVATYTATDPSSSVVSVFVTSIGGTAIAEGDQTSSNTAGEDDWSITLPPVTLEGLTGSPVVITEATDEAGNKTTRTFSLIVDTTAPTVAITSPANGATINKLTEIRGTASDAQMLDTVDLYIEDPSTGLIPVTPTASFTGGAAYNWSHDFDTEAWEGAGGSGEAGVRVIATDEAGNTATLNYTYIIDQESDRPRIKSSNVLFNSADGEYPTTLKSSKVVFGTIEDDDGQVTSVDVWNMFTSAWQPITMSGISYTFTTPDPDGSKILRFRITDAAGETFETGTALPPKFVWGPVGGESFEYAEREYKVDTQTPNPMPEVYVSRTGTSVYGDAVELVSNMPFGGTSEEFVLWVGAKDDNGIESIKVTIESTPQKTQTLTSADIDLSTGITDYTIFRSAPFNVNGAAGGSVSIKFEITDNSGLKGYSTKTILIDNDEPVIDYSYPVHNTGQVFGFLDINGLASDDGSGLDTIEYKIGYDYASQPTWIEAEKSGASWKVPAFASTTEPQVRIEDYTRKVVDSVSIDTNTLTVTGHGYANGTVVWIGSDSLPGGLDDSTGYYVRDATPNTFRLAASSGGDAINITSSGDASTGVSAVADSIAGNIWRLPVMIRALDKAGNEYVTPEWNYLIRVDPSGDKPTAYVSYPDVDTDPALPNPIVGGTIRMSGYAEDNVDVSEVYMQIDVNGDGNFTAADVDEQEVDWYDGGRGHKVSGSRSWNQTINANGEFNPSVPGTRRLIMYRVRARDNNDLYGSWTEPHYFEVDEGVPKYSMFVFEQGGRTLTYKPDLWLSGDWTLTGTVMDESDIGAIIVGNTPGAPASDVTGDLLTTDWFTTTSSGSLSGYKMAIPVDTTTFTGSTSHSFTISATDLSEPPMTASHEIRINYDNEKPDVSADFGGTMPIRNSNGSYELKSRVVEAESGFDRVMVVFHRPTGMTDGGRVYNPLSANTYTVWGSLTESDEGLPLMEYTEATRSSGTSLTHAGISSDPYAREGYYLRIGGSYYRITDVSGGTITWEGDVDEGITDFELVYAFAVDLLNTEVTDMDGDGIIEAVTRSGGNYDWSCSIDSTRLPDGQMNIRYVAFDKAGNFAQHADIVTRVENNPPLLAQVALATDLDGSGGITDGSGTTLDEWNLPYSLLAGGVEQKTATVTASDFIAKDFMEVVIDVVGGNGDLEYRLDVGGTTVHNLEEFNLRTGDYVEGFESTNTITVLRDDLVTIGEGAQSFVFSIWDSTETYALGTSTDFMAELTITLTVDVDDGEAPVTVISPFFWNDADDNSLYENSRVNGHIELEADLPALFDQATGLFDADPKVSGKISIRGTAYDNQRLTALWMYVGDTAAAGNFDFTPTATTKTFGGKTYYRMAIYTPGSGWTPTASDMTTNGWVFSADDDYLDQTGHHVSWQLDWDTSKVDGVAAIDQNVRIIAEDKRATPNASSEALADHSGDVKTNNVPYYRIDVVPYVTEVVTSLSDYYRSAPSVFNRTALGHYPVREGELIEIKGFNFDGTDTGVYLNGTLLAAPTVIEGKADSHLGVNIGSVASSGNMILTVAGVDSINNDNNNNVEYNQLPNTVNNNLLRDDVIFDVWEFKDAAVPKNGVIQNPTMKISPTGRIGFSYSNAVVYFSMPGRRYSGTGDANIYSQTVFNQSYGWFTNNTFTWDPRGETYGTALCPDTDAVGVTAHYQFFARQAGRPANSMSLNDNYNNTFNAARLDSTAISMHYTTRGTALNAAQRATWVTDIDRIKSPAMAASMPNPAAAPNNDTNRVTVHIAYYDKITRQVRYRQGFVGATARNYYDSVRDLLGDNGLPDDGNRTDPTASASGIYTRGSLAYMQDSSYIADNKIQVVAASGVNVAGVLPQYEATTPYGAGQFVDLGVIQTNAAQPTVVIAWYDTMSRQLMLSYNATPNTYTEDYEGGQWDNTWVNNTRVIDANGGQNVKMAIDSDGGIHLAYYNTNAGDLKYAYLASVTAAPQTVVVDSFLAVGARCTIDVAKVGTVQVPHISYQMNALSGTPAAAKYAYRVAYTDNNMLPVPAGTDSGDRYTGSWEITSIPTDNTPIDDQINVGVHKVWNGVGRGDQLAIPDGTDVSVAETNAFPVSDSTIIYGNGTMNAVVAYAVEEDGVLEMAQKK